ncbi:MAG: SPOR domain-containing protein [Pseudomonadota bacterium]
MEQRFDFEENDNLLTRMRQRFDTYQVPMWQRPAFWGGVLIVVAALFAVVLLVSGLNKSDEGDVIATADELPLIGADGQPMRQTPAGEDGQALTGTENNLFDTMGATDGAVVAEDGQGALTRADVEQAANANGAALPTKTDPLSAMESQDGVTVKNGVRVIAENKVGTTDPMAAATATTAPSVDELAPATATSGNTNLMNEVFEETSTDPTSAPTTTAAAPAPVAEAAPAAADSRYVQLASIREESAAAGHWDTLKSKHGATISALQYRVVKADIAGKGTYYRIQAGPVSAAKAQDICGTINATTPGSCLVVKP